MDSEKISTELLSKRDDEATNFIERNASSTDIKTLEKCLLKAKEVDDLYGKTLKNLWTVIRTMNKFAFENLKWPWGYWIFKLFYHFGNWMLTHEKISIPQIKFLVNLARLIKRNNFQLQKIKQPMDEESVGFMYNVIQRFPHWKSLVNPCLTVICSMPEEVQELPNYSIQNDVQLMKKLFHRTKLFRKELAMILTRCHQLDNRELITFDTLQRCVGLLTNGIFGKFVFEAAVKRLLELMLACLQTLSNVNITLSNFQIVCKLLSSNLVTNSNVILLLKILERMLYHYSGTIMDDLLELLIPSITAVVKKTYSIELWDVVARIVKCTASYSALIRHVQSNNLMHWLVPSAVHDTKTLQITLSIYFPLQDIPLSQQVNELMNIHYVDDERVLDHLCFAMCIYPKHFVGASYLLDTLIGLAFKNTLSSPVHTLRSLLSNDMTGTNLPVYRDTVLRKVILLPKRRSVASANAITELFLRFFNKFELQQLRLQYYFKEPGNVNTRQGNTVEVMYNKIMALEILSHIFELLDTKTIYTLRVVCKYFRLAVSNVRYVKLENFSSGYEAIQCASNIHYILPNITTLSVAGYMCDIFLCAFLFASPQSMLDQIKVLEIRQCHFNNIKLAEADLQLFRNLSRLTYVDVSSNHLMKILENTSSIQCLECTGSYLSNTEIMSIATVSNLKTLSFRGSRIHSLAALKDMKQLQYLDVRNTFVRQKDLPNVKVLQGGLKRIMEHVRQCQWNLTGDGIYVLHDSNADPEIMLLSLDGTVMWKSQLTIARTFVLSPDQTRMVIVYNDDWVEVVEVVDGMVKMKNLVGSCRIVNTGTPVWISNSHIVIPTKVHRIIKWDLVANKTCELSHTFTSGSILVSLGNELLFCNLSPYPTVDIWSLETNSTVLTLPEAQAVAVFKDLFACASSRTLQLQVPLRRATVLTIDIYKLSKKIFTFTFTEEVKSMEFLCETKLILLASHKYFTLDWSNGTPIWSNPTYIPITFDRISLSPTGDKLIGRDWQSMILLDLAANL